MRSREGTRSQGTTGGVWGSPLSTTKAHCAMQCAMSLAFRVSFSPLGYSTAVVRKQGRFVPRGICLETVSVAVTQWGRFLPASGREGLGMLPTSCTAQDHPQHRAFPSPKCPQCRSRGALRLGPQIPSPHLVDEQWAHPDHSEPM